MKVLVYVCMQLKPVKNKLSNCVLVDVIFVVVWWGRRYEILKTLTFY